MKQRFFALAVLLLSSCCIGAAQTNYRWTPVYIGPEYSRIEDSTATYIIRKFDPLLSSLYEVIGCSDDEYTARRPESGLSNFVADVIRKRAEAECGRKVHLAMTNFGGIRSSLPKGNITTYDILAIFPFDNRIEVFDISGKDLIATFNANVKNPEALSGVRLLIDDGKVESLEIDGAPVDPDKTYTFASIDFLIKGGDNVKFIGIRNLVNTGVKINTAIEDYIRSLSAGGGTISLNTDGRVYIKRSK